MYFFILLVIGFLLSPPSVIAQPDTAPDPDLPSLEWLGFDKALKKAEVSGRAVMVDVYAPWCPWCSKLQTEVYAKGFIREYLNEHFETARLNIDEEENKISFMGYELSSAELASGLGAEGTPTIVFLSSKGEYITRLPGFIEADEFIYVLKYISDGSFKTESFKEYRSRQP